MERRSIELNQVFVYLIDKKGTSMACCGRSKGRRSIKSKSRKLRPKNALDVKYQMHRLNEDYVILMCRPKYFGIEYTINPWMDLQNSVDHKKSVEQWNALKSKIEELGGIVKLIPPVKSLPDMVFTANAGMFLKNKDLVISTFLHKERKGEEEHFRNWFENNGFNVMQLEDSFEGAGDALYLEDKLIMGHGFRSSSKIRLSDHPVSVKLIDPYFYHLDTCFCPLNNGDYMIWEGAFEDPSLISSSGKKISVIESDSRKFCCNAVCIGKNVILPSGCEDTMSKLKNNGYVPHELDMSEFIKSGGACKCLTLRLP